MLPGADVLERKFEGFTNEEILLEVNKIVTAAHNTLVRRGSQLRPYDLDAFAPPPEPAITEVDGDPGPTETGETGSSSQEPELANTEPTAEPAAETPETNTDDLPADFPYLKVLAKAGITTRTQLKETSNVSLSEIPGIAAAALGKIRDAEVALLTQ